MSVGQFFIKSSIITIFVMKILYFFMPRGIVLEYHYDKIIREIKLKTSANRFR